MFCKVSLEAIVNLITDFKMFVNELLSINYNALKR